MPIVVSIVILIVAIIVGFSASIISNKPNSPVEELAEAVIKMETGMDIEFSPDDNKDLENHRPD